MNHLDSNKKTDACKLLSCYWYSGRVGKEITRLSRECKLHALQNKERVAN